MKIRTLALVAILAVYGDETAAAPDGPIRGAAAHRDDGLGSSATTTTKKESRRRRLLRHRHNQVEAVEDHPIAAAAEDADRELAHDDNYDPPPSPGIIPPVVPAGGSCDGLRDLLMLSEKEEDSEVDRELAHDDNYDPPPSPALPPVQQRDLMLPSDETTDRERMHYDGGAATSVVNRREVDPWRGGHDDFEPGRPPVPP